MTSEQRPSRKYLSTALSVPVLVLRHLYNSMSPVPHKDLLDRFAKNDDEKKQAEQTLETLVQKGAVRKDDNWMSGVRYQLVGKKALVYYVSLLYAPQQQRQ